VFVSQLDLCIMHIMEKWGTILLKIGSYRGSRPRILEIFWFNEETENPISENQHGMVRWKGSTLYANICKPWTCDGKNGAWWCNSFQTVRTFSQRLEVKLTHFLETFTSGLWTTVQTFTKTSGFVVLQVRQRVTLQPTQFLIPSPQWARQWSLKWLDTRCY